MPDKVEMSAENYIKAFEKGVLSSMSRPLTTDELKKLKESEAKSKVEKGQKYSETEEFDPSSGLDKKKTLKENILLLYNELGGKANQEILDMFKEYDEHGNPFAVKELSKLEEINNKLAEMKKGK